MNELLTEQALDDALVWCRKQRVNWPAHDVVWRISADWLHERQRCMDDLHRGTYQFEPVKIIKSATGKVSWIWHARDAIVLKAIATGLENVMRPTLSTDCTHLKGFGAIPKSISVASEGAVDHSFVFKSDVKGFYESINHDILMNQLKGISQCPFFLKLMSDFLSHHEEYGGLYNTLTVGISKSCPLSPLLGALYLLPLDRAMASLPVKYVRFMDDWIVFAKTRWHLRRAIKRANEVLNDLKMQKHPDKTFIGRVEKTFDFCGFKFSRQGVISLATATLQKILTKRRKLYEQSRRGENVVEKYMRRVTGYVDGVMRHLVCGERLVEKWLEAPG